jgi:hypothetical protein
MRRVTSSLSLGRKSGWEKRFEHGIVGELQPALFSYYSCGLLLMPKPDAEFSDEIQTKVFRVFLLAIHSHLYSLQLCLVISISSSSRNLLCISSNSRNLFRIFFLKSCNLLHISTVKLLYTVQEKGGKPDRKPHPLPYGLRNPYSNLKSEKSQCPETSTKLCTFMNLSSVITLPIIPC